MSRFLRAPPAVQRCGYYNSHDLIPVKFNDTVERVEFDMCVHVVVSLVIQVGNSAKPHRSRSADRPIPGRGS